MFLPKSVDQPEPEINFFVKLFRTYVDMTAVSSIRWNLLGTFAKYWAHVALISF